MNNGGKRNILVFTTSLSIGGVTSFAINLANWLNESCGFDVSLAYSGKLSQKSQELNPNVNLLQFFMPSKFKVILYMLRKRWGNYIIKLKIRNRKSISPMDCIQRVAYSQAMVLDLTKELKDEFDVVISTAEFFCNDVVAERLNAKRKIGWIHPDYSALNTDVEFDRKTLDKLDRIVTVSKSNLESLLLEIPIYKEKAIYVPNIINIPLIIQLSKEDVEDFLQINGINIVTVCRIDNSSKRLDRIVNASKYFTSKGLVFRWYIVGNGPDIKLLRKWISEAKLDSHIILLGEKCNPYPYIRMADVFVLTSQYEGKPIVIEEAKLLECPVIVTNYTSAEEQVLPNNGFIVDNDNDSIPIDLYNILTSTNFKSLNNKTDYINDPLLDEFENYLR